jgi:hypothetical protein
MILHELTEVWEFMYSQESKLSSTGKQSTYGIIFQHYASHKATSYKMSSCYTVCDIRFVNNSCFRYMQYSCVFCYCLEWTLLLRNFSCICKLLSPFTWHLH